LIRQIIIQALFISMLISMDVEYLEKNSMLYQSKELAKIYSGKKDQWLHPYGTPQPEKLINISSNWFTSYAPSTLKSSNESLWAYLGSEELWKNLQEVGIDGIHLGPTKLAGEITESGILPSVDGGFDPISYRLDAQYGSMQEYDRFAKTVKKHHAIIIGDLVPGHTGRGFDFQLALRNYKDYPGIYHMVEINHSDWPLLPRINDDKISINLNPQEVNLLKQKGYIVGPLKRVLFFDPVAKRTNWDATREIIGIDGKKRRWVYLHYFKDNQPTLNWLDPSFAANRVISGDIITSHDFLSQKVLRMDANAFLGIELNQFGKHAYSEAHPLSIVASDTIAILTRKLGGFSFQELNMPLNDIKQSMKYGPDLSYDFLERAAAFHALLKKDTSFLRLCMRLLLEKGLQPMQFVHALQNHDEINFELIHFLNNKESFSLNGKSLRGHQLRKEILEHDFNQLYKKNNYTCSIETGPCTTILGLCAASLGIKDIYRMSDKEKQQVKKAHLLLAFFNAMQPGVFAISGWDIVGALPLRQDIVEPYAKDGDKRWANRGSYDLLGNGKKNGSNLPESIALYGSIPSQMKDPNSFLSHLKRILKARKDYLIESATLISVPKVKTPALIVLIHRLNKSNLLQMSAINFSDKEIAETIKIDGIKNTNAMNILTRKPEEKDTSSAYMTIKLSPLEGKSIVFSD